MTFSGHESPSVRAVARMTWNRSPSRSPYVVSRPASANVDAVNHARVGISGMLVRNGLGLSRVEGKKKEKKQKEKLQNDLFPFFLFVVPWVAAIQ